MKRFYMLAAAFLMLSATAASGQRPSECGYGASNAPRKVEVTERDKQRAAELTAKMTLSEKIAYISASGRSTSAPSSGSGFPRYAWPTVRRA